MRIYGSGNTLRNAPASLKFDKHNSSPENLQSTWSPSISSICSLPNRQEFFAVSNWTNGNKFVRNVSNQFVGPYISYQCCIKERLPVDTWKVEKFERNCSTKKDFEELIYLLRLILEVSYV